MCPFSDTLHLLTAACFVLVWVALSTPGCAQESSGEAPGEEATRQGSDEVWVELCQAATIEERCSGSICYREAVIPIESYCRHHACALSLAEYEEHFSTCESPEEDWPRCGWQREVGCGLVQYTQPNDESSFHALAFDEADGALLGFVYSSDSPISRCDADGFRVGSFNAYFHRREPLCAAIEEELCCHRDPPHRW